MGTAAIASVDYGGIVKIKLIYHLFPWINWQINAKFHASRDTADASDVDRPSSGVAAKVSIG